MKQKGFLCALAGLLLTCCVSFQAIHAQELGYWRASSSSAQSVTGDVGISEGKVTIYFVNYTIVKARELEPAEVSSVFDVDSNNASNKGRLYKLDIPGAKKFMHKNTLCGGEDAQWMAVYSDSHTLHLAFFSGQKAPVFTLDAISNSSDMCGTYSYTR